MKRKEAKDRTREQVLAAAEKVFAEKGVRAAKVSDIVREAGVAQGTFYIHFENKAEVVDRLVARYNRRHGSLLVRAAVRNLRVGTRAIIRAQARAHIEFWRAHRTLFPMVVDHLARHSREEEPMLLRDVSEAIAAFADDVLSSSRAERRVSSRELARTIVTLWRQAGLNVARDESVDPDDAVLALELTTIAIYDALAPGLLDVSKRDLAAAYRRIVTATRERMASASSAQR
ncbi:MAG: TetR/AcrR family transcriptional regulator [Sandaracinaceae bacterium]